MGAEPGQAGVDPQGIVFETWRQPGPLRRFLTILLHGRNVLVRFNTPIALSSISREGLNEEQALRKFSRVLRVHFRRQREMAIGPDLSHRNTQVETLLAASAVRRAIADEAAKLGIQPDEAKQRARRFALEIASDHSYGAVRALELFLSAVDRAFTTASKRTISTSSRASRPGRALFYVPAHRSHIDYLLLSYLLHDNGFTPPHIAAGANQPAAGRAPATP